MKTLIISSSLSEKSRSFILCNEIKARLEKLDNEVTLIDARELELLPTHIGPTKSMEDLAEKIKNTDNIIFGMGVHCYSVNDSLKMILDNCCSEATGKFFGILCAAGGTKSYLATMQLTQIAMNEWRMIQLPRIVFATGADFNENEVSSEDVLERMDKFSNEFNNIGKKLLA